MLRAALMAHGRAQRKAPTPPTPTAAPPRPDKTLDDLGGVHVPTGLTEHGGAVTAFFRPWTVEFERVTAPYGPGRPGSPR